MPTDGTITSASAGCETYVYGDPNNCGQCGNVSISQDPLQRLIQRLETRCHMAHGLQSFG